MAFMTSASDLLTQRSDDAILEIAPADGGRIRSLRVRGVELLRATGRSELDWGCYPMAPWTGRVRNGRFTFAGRGYALPLRHEAHAIHGTVYYRPWRVVDDQTLTTDLGEDWPFAGFVRQHYRLSSGRLDLRIEVHATAEPMPASCGWHPWFLRRLSTGGEARIEFDAGFMLTRDAENIPGEPKVPPRPGPWDDAFGDVRWPATIRWSNGIELRLTSACRYAVVYDEQVDGICIEPTTAPPNALNAGATIVTPGAPLVAECTWEWG